jgi:multidrug efflux pump subunit AcrA (membrane-fusion protein)
LSSRDDAKSANLYGRSNGTLLVREILALGEEIFDMSTQAPIQKHVNFKMWAALGATLLIASLAAGAFLGVIPGLDLGTMRKRAVDESARHVAHHAHDGPDHTDHDRGHLAHGDANCFELSQQARNNIGLQLTKIELRPFERTVAVPASVIERPGRSELDVTASLSGIVLQIYPIQGQAVTPGQPLFDLRLTHEELVQAQTDFLRTAEELDIVTREVARLEPLEAKGAIALKTILDRRYEKEKLAAVLRSQRQGLILHGLTAEQIDQILAQRTLLQGLTIVVPQPNDPSPTANKPKERVYEVQQLNVEKGQFVNAGDRLCVLTDHSELYIEGKAFEQDAELLNTVLEKGWEVTAVFDSEGKKPKLLPGLKVLYVADRIETDSRTLRFFVRLPNRLLRDTKQDVERFISWEFKPGQRLQLRVPVEHWPDRIVLPADAVIQEGVENYVFQQNGDHFDRRPVHVEYREPSWVVVANDGSVFPGDTVVTSGAQQMQLALKNKSGGAIDPHAGHNH